MTNAGITLSHNVLDHLDGTSTWTAPTNLYIALLKSASAAGDDSTTNAAKEILTPGTNSYARQLVTFAAAASQQKLSDIVVTFGPATTADWPTATHAWLIDSNLVNTGTIWYQGALVAPKTVEVSGSLIFEVGEIKLKLA